MIDDFEKLEKRLQMLYEELNYANKLSREEKDILLADIEEVEDILATRDICPLP